MPFGLSVSHFNLEPKLSMAQKYCESFGRRDMADTAFSRLNGTKAEQNLTNHPQRFVTKSPKPLKIKDNK
jgi:hypothetical protein